MIKRINSKHIEAGQLYSVSEVAEVAGYHPNTVRKHIKCGKLQALCTPGKMLLKGEEVLEFLNHHVNG